MTVWHHLKTGWAPVAAIVGGTVAALSGSGHSSASVAAARAPTEASAPAPEPPQGWEPFLADAPSTEDEPDDDASPALSGEVLEEIDVGKYSYLRLGGGSKPEFWAAVPKTTGQLGRRVTVKNAELMTDFASPTLKRKFDAIYFGMLDDGAVQPEPAADHDPQKAGPHPGPGKGADAVPVGKVARAAGPLGHTVAELNRAVPELTGKKARVRGVVVKSTLGVLGRTFLHLRDGSGEAADGSNDLTITTSAEPAVGSEIVVEGTVERDRDFGSGYRYPVLLGDATLVGE